MVGTSSTLTSNDQLVGGGHDILTLLGSGTFDLSSLAQFSGFAEVQTTGSNFVVDLPNGQNINVDASVAGNGTINLGSGSSTVTLSNSQTVNFSNGTDTVTGSGASSTFNMSGGTANISLTNGSGSLFDFGSGNATVALNNFEYGDSFALGTGSENITFGSAAYLELVNFNLSSGQFSIDASAAGGGYFNHVNSYSHSRFSGRRCLKGPTTNTNYLYLTGTDGTYDLSSSTIQNISNLSLWAPALSLTAMVSVALHRSQARAPSSIRGRRPTCPATSVGQGTQIESSNTSGTTFLVKDFQTALDILPGPAPDTVQAEGFNFTATQRDQLFDQGNAVVSDSTGVSGSPGSEL